MANQAGVEGMLGAGFTSRRPGQAGSDRLALKPYWGKLTVGNFFWGGAIETPACADTCLRLPVRCTQTGRSRDRQAADRSASFEARSTPLRYPTLGSRRHKDVSVPAAARRHDAEKAQVAPPGIRPKEWVQPAPSQCGEGWAKRYLCYLSSHVAEQFMLKSTSVGRPLT